MKNRLEGGRETKEHSRSSVTGQEDTAAIGDGDGGGLDLDSGSRGREGTGSDYITDGQHITHTHC